MNEAHPNGGPLITAVNAREGLDCRGLPTVQVDIELEQTVTGTADVPSGRSTRATEAHELLPRIATSPDHFECQRCAWERRCWSLQP